MNTFTDSVYATTAFTAILSKAISVTIGRKILYICDKRELRCDLYVFCVRHVY